MSDLKDVPNCSDCVHLIAKESSNIVEFRQTLGCISCRVYDSNGLHKRNFEPKAEIERRQNDLHVV